MSVRSALLVLVASTPLTQLGCDTGLQNRLNEARGNRFEAAKQAVFAVEAARNDFLKSSLPAPDAKPTGDDHPMMAWRKATTARNDADLLRDLASRAKLPQPTTRSLTKGEAAELGTKYRKGWYDCTITEGNGIFQESCQTYATVMAMGTPSQAAAEVGASFLRDVNEYWTSKTSLSRYLNAISGFDVMAAKSKDDAAAITKEDPTWEFVEPPFSDEARFDTFFIHAASMLQLSALPDRTVAWDAMHPDYGVVFGMARRSGEGSSDYVSRLCFAYDGLKDKCKGVPHEYRAALVDRAFLEAMLVRAKAYRATTTRGQVFNDVTQSIAKSLEAAVATPLAFKEEFVLPSTFAPIGGRSGVRVVFSPAGIVATTDKDVVLLDKYTGLVPKTVQPEIVKLLTELRDQPGNRIDYQRIILELEGSTSMPSFIDAVRTFPALLGEASGVKEIFLLGRRRVDDSMRLASVKLRIPRADDSPTISYQFKDDAEKTTCQLLGQVGDPPAGKKNEFFLEVTPDRVRAAPLSINEETAERTPGDTVALGTAADLTAVKAWLDENPGRLRAFVKVNGDYDKLMRLISDLLYKCTDEEIAFDDATKQPLKRTCGRSEARSVNFILGICD